MKILLLNVKIDIMKREDIEKEAESRYDENISEQYNNGYSIGFKEGAEWMLNSIWHDASEAPKKKEYILVQINELYPIYVVWSINSTDWDKTAERANAVKWAYIEDLLPIK